MHSRELEERGEGSRIGPSIRKTVFREGRPAWSLAMRLQHPLKSIVPELPEEDELSSSGVFKQTTGSGRDGIVDILQRLDALNRNPVL